MRRGFGVLLATAISAMVGAVDLPGKEAPEAIDSETSSSSETTTSVTTITETATTTTQTSTTSTTATQTVTTTTTLTETSTTATSTTTTVTTSTSTTSTSTTGPHVFGGQKTVTAFRGWLAVWRSKYLTGLWNAGIQDPWESLMPQALKKVKCRVVVSAGGVAGGIVTEGMGYGMMLEGFLAAKGDKQALMNGLSLMKSWLGMVNGPGGLVHPLAGGANFSESSTKSDTWPYGVSAVEWSHLKLAPSGVPAWKFPINTSKAVLGGFVGSASDADQDAILGMIYLAAALHFPRDFVDVVIRAVISFASADLGFPDMYRILPDGHRVYVPKLGSMWGGLTPPKGTFKTSSQPWCYSPGYFAPAHYRTFRDFAQKHWDTSFDDYLPMSVDGSRPTLDDMLDAFDSAVTAGYNILYYSSCDSGTVSNWVGVEAPCAKDDQLSCAGVPWQYTPYIGAAGGKCSQSGTAFGAFGADASRTHWRIAMDYVLFREESSKVMMYDRKGQRDEGLQFGARKFLNRVVIQYWKSAICDGGEPGNCMKHTRSPYEFAFAYDLKSNATGTTCSGVPGNPESWWAGFMAYPTFTAFVAPYDEIGAAKMTSWMDTFSSICDFSKVNLSDYSGSAKPEGDICLTSYFEASQAVISTMVMANILTPLAEDLGKKDQVGWVTIEEDELPSVRPRSGKSWLLVMVAPALAFLAVTAWLSAARRARCTPPYKAVRAAAALLETSREFEA